MNRPETTLFMLMSVDGKISTGDTSEMDFDKDFSNVKGVREGLFQYYELEKTTDNFSLNTGKVFQKIGVNEHKVFKDGVPVSFVVVDNKPHLTTDGLIYLAEKTDGVYIVSTHSDHPAQTLSHQNEKIKFLQYSDQIDFDDVFQQLKNYGAERLTIQSGGTMNATLLRNGLVDNVSVVVAPVLIGGGNTPTIVDGESLHTQQDLLNLRPLELKSCTTLESSYLHLQYKVLNS